ncbi:MAG: ABC transporter permease [Muribaculaceae bacterium]|nr:ABC transporter permease [Muribaculaceae bacterium]
MKRKLIKQMSREWRDNIWLILSMAITFTVVWAAIFLLYIEVHGYFLPRGYDCGDVYSIDLSMIGQSSEYYDEGGKDKETEDLGVLLKRIEALPMVEAVMFHYSAMPYNFNYYGQRLKAVGNDSLPEYYGNRREASPEVIDVLRIKSKTGATPSQLKEMLERGELLLGDDKEYNKDGKGVYALKGRMVELSGDTTRQYRVGDIIDVIRRNDYEESYSGTILMALDVEKPWGNVAVRVKPGMGHQFEKEFREKKELRINRNIFLTDLKSADEMRDSNQRTTEIKIRQYVVVALFVLVTIFLGMLGIFWFRVQQRVGEIAIRRVCGATRRDILSRILGEGLILFLVAMIIVSLLLWIFVIPEFLEEADLWWEAIWCELGAVVVVAVGIVLSLIYPALRAMNIEPAIAVKAE